MVKQQSELKNMYLTNTLQSQNLNFIALLFFCFVLPYHWSS